MRDQTKKSWAVLCALFLLALLFFSIPIEHKYDKLFRLYSHTLLPDGLTLPRPLFDRKIFFYASDLMILALFGWMCIKRCSLLRGTFFLIGFLLCGLLSIVCSPLSHYPVVYLHFLQFLTPVLLFVFLVNGPIRKELLFKYLSRALIATSCLQSIFACAQYVLQHPLGLRLFSEQPFQAAIAVPGGHRFLFDQLMHRVAPSEIVYRAAGTLSHPNLLGGLLLIGLMLTTYFLWQFPKRRKILISIYLLQFLGLAVTYSRAALFAYLLASGIWFFWMWRSSISSSLRTPILTALSSILLVTILLHEQYVCRGGVFNYPPSVAQSDQERLLYQEVAMQMVTASPMTGVGFGQFSLQAPSFLPQGVAHLLANVHNIYLLIAAELGMAALLFFLGWIFSIFWSFFRSTSSPESKVLFSIFVGFLFIGFCDFYPIACQQGRLCFFGIAGLLTRFSQDLSRESLLRY